MAESKEELKSLLIKVKEESEKAGLKLNIQKPKIMASGPISQFSTVQSLSRVWLFANLWTVARQVLLSITNSHNLLKLMPVELVMPSNHLILWHPLLLLPLIFPSIRVFCSESVLSIRWPSIGASASTSVLKMNIQDWLPLVLTALISLQSKGLKSLLQHQSSKASILQCSAFFMGQVSHPYMTTGKTIVLTKQTFVGKIMSAF